MCIWVCMCVCVCLCMGRAICMSVGSRGGQESLTDLHTLRRSTMGDFYNESENHRHCKMRERFFRSLAVLFPCVYQ
jgi:hypothetical protein